VEDLFAIYTELRDLFQSGEPARDTEFWSRLRLGLRRLDSKVDEEATRQKVEFLKSELYPLMRRIDSGAKLPDSMWRQVIESYADLIQAVGAEKGVYMTPRRLPGEGPVRWLRLQRSSPKEEAVEVLRREDPDLYERTQQSKRLRRQIADKIKERIRQDGLEPGFRRLWGRPVSVGVHPNGSYDVYDDDGEVLTPGEFGAKLADKRDVNHKLRVVNPAKYMLDEDLDFLRRFSEEKLASLPGDVEYVALTDDPKKSSKLTRIYPVKEDDNGQKVVVSGRFRGIPMASLVNLSGRQIEGSSHSFDVETGRITKRESRRKGEDVELRKNAEPYVTEVDGKLLLRIPNWKMYRPQIRAVRGWEEGKTVPGKKRKSWTKHKGLVDLVPSIEYVEGSRNTEFTFEVTDFAVIQETIGGLALSHRASVLLQEYYAELSRAEQASNAKNLKRYSNESLGFKTASNRRIRTHIKKSLAWLDANGNKGICGLDTGMGKTVVALAAMANLSNKGDGQGYFVYVCPQKLLGSLPKEAHKFLPRERAKALLDRVRIMSYEQLNAARKADPTFADDAEAVYFDEAHLKMGKKTSVYYQAAVDIKAARKVLLTASVMTRSPMEILTLSSVANGVDLNSPEGLEIERKFQERFVVSVGGKPVGINPDPTTSRDFRVWVKRNLFFADKRDVEEEGAALAITGLGRAGRDIKREAVVVTMPPDIEGAYRDTMQEMLEVLQSWSQFNQFDGDVPLAIEVSKNRRAMKKLLKRRMEVTVRPRVWSRSGRVLPHR